MTSPSSLSIHPTWRAKVLSSGSLTVSARVRLTAETGLTHLAAMDNLERVRWLLLAEAELAIMRLTRDRDAKAYGPTKEDREARGGR